MVIIWSCTLTWAIQCLPIIDKHRSGHKTTFVRFIRAAKNAEPFAFYEALMVQARGVKKSWFAWHNRVNDTKQERPIKASSANSDRIRVSSFAFFIASESSTRRCYDFMAIHLRFRFRFFLVWLGGKMNLSSLARVGCYLDAPFPRQSVFWSTLQLFIDRFVWSAPCMFFQ